MNIGKNPNGLNQISSSLVSLYVSGSNTIEFTPTLTHVIGAVSASSFTGSLQGTASYALNTNISINTSSLATTGSNTFKGNQIIIGDVIITGSDYINSTIRFISGAIITTSGPNIDMVAGPGGWSELGSNNSENYVWVEDEFIYLATNWASGAHVWSFNRSGSLTAGGNINMNGFTITGSLQGTSSYASTSSYINHLYQDVNIDGNLNVIGTASFTYTTSSIVQVGASTIVLNTNYPATRFGGMEVIDSGSFGNSSTGSLLWDSLNNKWIYANPSGSTYDGGMLISGPRNTSGLGNEEGTTANAIMKGQGGDHITSSAIIENGTSTNFYNSASIITSTGTITATSFTGSLSGTASYAVTASYWSGSIINAASASFATTASYALNAGASISTGSFATTGSNIFVGNQTITGSLKVTGSIEINNTNIQYYNPQSVLFLPPVYTLVTSASTTYNVHVTQSGPYFIDCTNIPNNQSCSVNFYVYPDLMPIGFVANINSYAPISTGSNSSTYINYRTIVSASNSTSYYTNSTSAQGITTNTISRFSFIPRPTWVPLGENNAGWFFRTPANQVMLLNKPVQLQGSPTIQALSFTLFTGSNGTPIA